LPPPPTSTLFPYTTLFRSVFEHGKHPHHIVASRKIAVARNDLHIGRSMGQYVFIGRYLPLYTTATVVIHFNCRKTGRRPIDEVRSEEHTSELQSRENLVCR